MTTDTEKSKLRENLYQIEIGLAIVLTVGAIVLVVGWLYQLPIERHVLLNGAIELRESRKALMVAILVCACAIIVGVAKLARNRRGQWAIAGTFSLLFGLGIGGVAVWPMAVRNMLVFDPTGVTVTAAPWLGGDTQAKLVYSKIEWLGTTERIYWKRRRHLPTVLSAKEKPSWKREVVYQYWVKEKAANVTTLDLRWAVRGGWNEILRVAQAAGVTVKPVERIEMPRETD